MSPEKTAQAHVRFFEAMPVAAHTCAQVTDATVGQTIVIPNAGQIDFSLYQPYGVVGGITPWNSPFFLAMLKVGAALATGNCIVLKPASITPMTPLLVCECFAEAGLPAGALDFV